MLSPMAWVAIVYLSLGIWFMLPGIVHACRYEPYSTILKIIASVVSVLVWPLAFFI